jgi:hypothetical protein
MGNPIRRVVFPLVSVVTAALVLVSTAFAGQDATLNVKHISTFQGTSTAAVVFSGIAFIYVVTLAVGYVRNIKWLDHGLIPLVGALVGLASAILTLDIIILERYNPKYFPEFTTRTNTARIIIWSFANVFQLIFYTLYILIGQDRENAIVQRRRTPTPLSSFEERKYGLGKLPRLDRPLSPIQMEAPSHNLSKANGGLSVQTSATPRRNSWRNSLVTLQQAVRPTSSKNRLPRSESRTGITRASMSRNSSFSDTKSNSGGSDSFDWWEYTSPVHESPETTTRDIFSPPGNVSVHIPSRLASGIVATSLEPIPGSRPVSPAETLDVIEQMLPDTPPPKARVRSPISGYFPPSAIPLSSLNFENERPSTSYSVQSISAAIIATTPSSTSLLSRPPTAYSTFSNTSSTTLRDRANTITTPPTIPTSTHGTRSNTPTGPEAHIHPLFRTDSPTPAPAITSARTIVTASPLSGTVLPRSMSPKPSLARRSRHPSRSNSQSALREPSSGRGTPVDFGSAVFTGLGPGPTIVDEVWEAALQEPSPPRTPGSSNGRTTPIGGSPIPAFVLNISNEKIQ